SRRRVHGLRSLAAAGCWRDGRRGGDEPYIWVWVRVCAHEALGSHLFWHSGCAVRGLAAGRR
ncbi:MAG: hypothetical protein NZ741_12035, partial [Armatimonadetes bacterium]|nr:hypothetical protein [Armatimonadota bacterium]